MSGFSHQGPDRMALETAAAHPFVLQRQVSSMRPGEPVDWGERLDRLVSVGLLARSPTVHRDARAFRITAAGLRAADSGLPVPVLDLRRYWEDAAAGWLWVSAHRGRYGEVDGVFSERQMRAVDDHAPAAVAGVERLSEAVQAQLVDPAFAVALADGERHYPTLALVVAAGRVVMELIVGQPSRAQFRRLLDGYVEKPQVRSLVLVMTDAAALKDAKTLIEQHAIRERVRFHDAQFRFMEG